MTANRFKKSLSTSSHAIRIRWAAIGAAIAVSLGGGVTLFAQAAPPRASSSTFVAVSPVRVLDTRNDFVLWAGPFVTGEPHDVKVTGSIPTSSGTQTVMPAGSTGVVLTVTVVNSTADGFVSVRPADAVDAPKTSNINFESRKTVANSITVNLPTSGSDAGTFEVWFDSEGVAGATADILVDITGYYSSSTIAEIQTAIGNNSDAIAEIETAIDDKSDAIAEIETAIDNKSDAIAIIGSGGEDFGDIRLTSNYGGLVWDNQRWVNVTAWSIQTAILYFESANCSGDPYAASWDEAFINWFDGIGQFFETDYDQLPVTAEDNDFHSFLENGSCTFSRIPSDFQSGGDHWIGWEQITDADVEFYPANIVGETSENLNLMWAHISGENQDFNSFSFVPRSSSNSVG